MLNLFLALGVIVTKPSAYILHFLLLYLILITIHASSYVWLCYWFYVSVSLITAAIQLLFKISVDDTLEVK